MSLETFFAMNSMFHWTFESTITNLISGRFKIFVKVILLYSLLFRFVQRTYSIITLYSVFFFRSVSSDSYLFHEAVYSVFSQYGLLFIL